MIVANRNTYSLSVVTAERSNFWHTRNLAAFYGQLTEYRSLYASTYYNVYRSITHAPGLSQSISLDSLLVTHLGYVQRNHVLIDIFTHWCGWRLIFRQEKDWVFFVLVYSSCLHPPTHHDQFSFIKNLPKNIKRFSRYRNFWGMDFNRYLVKMYHID